MPEPVVAEVRPARPADFQPVVALLGRAGLPVAGVPPTLAGFFVAEVDEPTPGERLVGAIGLEEYGTAGVLRSAVVATQSRGAGVGAALVRRLLADARARGIHDVYLLTTTAEAWFPRFGFVRIARVAVPAALHASEEFNGACPDSAIVMHTTLTD